MKWTDLQWGDKIRLRQDFLSEFIDRFGRLPDLGTFPIKDPNELFSILGIDMNGPYIRIYIAGEHSVLEINMHEDGAFWSLPSGPPVFELVEVQQNG